MFNNLLILTIMKKLLYCAAALATLLFAASCQQEKFETMGDGMVTFTVTAPGDLDTRAIADGEKVNEVHWAVYKTYEAPNALNGTDGPLAQGIVPMQNKKATLELDLLQDQDYTVLFWAQVKDAGHYNVGDLRSVSVASTTIDANDETRDAFFQRHDFNTEKQQNYDVTLVRPFAQINLGTTTESLTPVLQGQLENGGYTIDVQKSEMTVKGLAKSFSLVDGDPFGQAADESVEFTFTSTATPAKAGEKLVVNETEYHYVAMNYLFVPIEEKLVDVTYKITTDKGVVSNAITSVPVKENYRTNIIGNLLTSKTDFEIIVDERFEVPENVINDGWNQTGNYTYSVGSNATQEALKEILEHADAQAREAATRSEGPVVTIDLNGDVYWETGAAIGSTPLLPEDSPISKVVINGNGKSFIATGKGVGPVRLANGGLLTFNDVKIIDLSVSYAEDSWEYGYLEMGGELELMDCEVVNAIQLSGNVDVENTTFNSNEDNQYAVWVDGGVAWFTSCSFTGARGIKIHEKYGSEVEEVVVTECDFGPLTVKPGIAIGTVNAATTIYIVDSRFINCQAGDQNLYIYETDTDVTTFDFLCEDNEIYDTPNDMLETSLENAAAGETVTIPAGEYTFPASLFKEGVTLQCAEGTVFTGTSALDIKGATVEGATFSNPTGNSVGGTINGTFKNCTFDGSNALRYCYAGETVVFEDCVFSGDVYGVHFDGGENDIIFRRCIFSGFNALGGAITLATFEDCTFKANGRSGYNGINLWGSTKMVNTEFTFDGTASTEWVDCIGADKSYEFANCTLNGGSIMNKEYIWSRNDETDITIDGVCYPNYMTTTLISTAEELFAFANEVNVNKNAFNGKTVYLVADIDLDNAEWTPIGNSTNQFQGTFDGNNKTISNLVITGNNSNVGLFGMTTNGEIKNLTVNNAKVSGYLNVAVVAGTPYTSKYTNIKVTGHVEVNGFAYVGAVGGKNAYANWTDVTVDVDETSYVNANSVENGTAYRTYVGGVCGFNGEGGHTFTNISSNIDVTGSTIDVGGLFGIAHYGNNFVNCSCSGDVEITAATEAAEAEEMGGIAGVWHNQNGTKVTFDGCSFTGTLKANITEGVDLSDNTIVGKAYSASGTGELIIK